MDISFHALSIFFSLIIFFALLGALGSAARKRLESKKCERQFQFDFDAENYIGAAAERIDSAGIGVVSVDTNSSMIRVKTKPSFKSWGEEIRISFFVDSSGARAFSINSSSRVPTTVVDFGKNSSNIDLIVSLLKASGLRGVREVSN